MAMPILWAALRLPPGFRETARKSQVMPGGHEPVAHLVFTDGLASVSVFVESSPSAGGAASLEQVSGVTRVGSTSAFSTVVEGHRVTAVGEVPPSTVQFIAKAMKSQQAASFNPPQH
jgi:sigma-E factor negative regulatory protein RseB